MFGPNWYFAMSKHSNLRFEGVESSLVEHRFGVTARDLSHSLTKVSKSKTSSNSETIDLVIGTLASIYKSNSTILEIAKSKLSSQIYEEIKKSAKLRKKFDDDYSLRDQVMLRAMKSRTKKSGLLMVGRNHIKTMSKSPKTFCNGSKVLNPADSKKSSTAN